MPWMLAMVCVVQIGSSTRTSACSTARRTFCWALAMPAGIATAASATARMMARLDGDANVHRPILATSGAGNSHQYACASACAQYVLARRTDPCTQSGHTRVTKAATLAGHYGRAGG